MERGGLRTVRRALWSRTERCTAPDDAGRRSRRATTPLSILQDHRRLHESELLQTGQRVLCLSKTPFRRTPAGRGVDDGPRTALRRHHGLLSGDGYPRYRRADRHAKPYQTLFVLVAFGLISRRTQRTYEGDDRIVPHLGLQRLQREGSPLDRDQRNLEPTDGRRRYRL